MIDDYFEYGESIDVNRLTEDEAAQFFGRPIYEVWRQTMASDSAVAIRIVSVSRSKRQIVISVIDDD